MSAVPVALQKRFSPPRFQPVQVSSQWRDAIAPTQGEECLAGTPERDTYSQILADDLSDAPATQPLDQLAVALVHPSILDQAWLKLSTKSFYYTRGPSLDVLFQDHIQAPPEPIAVPPEIISELDAVQDDAVEEGFPVPSDDLVEDVRRLLAKVYQIAPNLPYMIYPMEKGEIAIHVSNEPTGIVLLLCHETETWCVASIGDSPCRAWFRDRERLPEAFVREALATLKSGVAW